MTDHIDHAAEARKLLARYEKASMHIIEATAAQAHATLALVEQQRIANLIALAQFHHESKGEVVTNSTEFALRLKELAAKELGL